MKDGGRVTSSFAAAAPLANHPGPAAIPFATDSIHRSSLITQAAFPVPRTLLRLLTTNQLRSMSIQHFSLIFSS